MPVEATSERLERILVLVPWVVGHPGITVTEVCERFAVTREELLEDLNLLFLCGLPPFGPGDLIVAYVDGDEVVIDMADYLARPMRLTRAEALSLLVMGRAIASLPGIEQAESLRSALVKLENAVTDAGGMLDLASRVDVDLDEESAGTLQLLGDAIGARRRVRIAYYSFGRDQMTERTMCPLLVFSSGGHWYVEAFDDASGEERMFRVDRIKEIAVTDRTCTAEEAAGAGREPPEQLFVPSEHDMEAVIEVGPQAAWVREGIVHEKSEDLSNGWTRLVIRTPHLAWLERMLLRLGSHGRAVSPPELIRGAKELAGRALARY